MTRYGLFLILSAFLSLMIAGPASADPARDVYCAGCVGSSDIRDGGVKNADIAAGVVTAGKIRDGAITSAKIRDGVVTTGKIKDGSVIGAKIRGRAVEWDHLVASLQDRILKLEATVAALEDALVDNTVLKLDGYLDLDTTDPAKPTARFAGVNVQVVNGLGETESVNGLGNLLVGYDEPHEASRNFICSDGRWETQDECEAKGSVWSSHHKSGSHNLVTGRGNRYSQSGGLIAGQENTVNGIAASVTGGSHNIASRPNASITGGQFNGASLGHSVVSGGFDNIASGGHSVVSGGNHNRAKARVSVVSGGVNNIAKGPGSVVSGGDNNKARGDHSVVSGGISNIASGNFSVVSGGSENTASGWRSVVSGGYRREASDDYDWVAGELFQDE